MTLRFFADHCVPGSVIRALREGGHEVVRLKDHLPLDSPDRSVISRALQLDAVLLSLNGDFADIVTYPPAGFKGIVAFQVRNHPEVIPLLVARFRSYLEVHGDMDHYLGKLFLVEAHRIRSRG